MTKRQEAAQKIAHARLHGELLCHFANASSAKEALLNLYSDAEKAYRWPDIAKLGQTIVTRHLKSIQRDASILKTIQAVKDFLTLKACPNLLLKTVVWPDRISVITGFVECVLDGKLGPYKAGPYLPIVQCSTLTFLMEMEGWERLICRCAHCEKFFLAKTEKGSRFCSDKCKNHFHNRKRIESGEAREYKSRRRREGKDQ